MYKVNIYQKGQLIRTEEYSTRFEAEHNRAVWGEKGHKTSLERRGKHGGFIKISKESQLRISEINTR